MALYTFGAQTSIVFGSTIWASFITSLLSILLSIMTWSLRRTGNNDYFRISLKLSVLDVVNQIMKHTVNKQRMRTDSNFKRVSKHTVNGMDIEVRPPRMNADKYNADAYFECMIQNSKYRNQLGIQMANHFGIASSNIEILSAYPLQNKLEVNGIFRCNKHESHKFDSDTLEARAICIEFVELFQDVYDIDGAWFGIQIHVYHMDEAHTSNVDNERQTNTAITAPSGDREMDALSLLNKWKLGMYWNTLRQRGFTEVEEWKDLVLDTEKLKGWGFKEGHILQFQRKYKEEFHSLYVQIELQSNDVHEMAGGDTDKGRTNVMAKIQSYSTQNEGIVKFKEEVKKEDVSNPDNGGVDMALIDDLLEVTDAYLETME
eukprot:169182_1